MAGPGGGITHTHTLHTRTNYQLPLRHPITALPQHAAACMAPATTSRPQVGTAATLRRDDTLSNAAFVRTLLRTWRSCGHTVITSVDVCRTFPNSVRTRSHFMKAAAAVFAPTVHLVGRKGLLFSTFVAGLLYPAPQRRAPYRAHSRTPAAVTFPLQYPNLPGFPYPHYTITACQLVRTYLVLLCCRLTYKQRVPDRSTAIATALPADCTTTYHLDLP